MITPLLSLDPFTQRLGFAGLAEAWVTAADGLVGDAIAIVNDTGCRPRSVGSPAAEVWCLQTAAQFGDASGAGRLVELETVVQGPRVAAASAHAAALRDACGDRLLSGGTNV